MRHINRPSKKAQNKLLWMEKLYPATHSAHHELESIILISVTSLSIFATFTISVVVDIITTNIIDVLVMNA